VQALLHSLHCEVQFVAPAAVCPRDYWLCWRELVHCQHRAMLAGPGFSFQRMSHGLDAGVSIYSKRVESTWKLAFTSMRGMPGAGGRCPTKLGMCQADATVWVSVPAPVYAGGSPGAASLGLRGPRPAVPPPSPHKLPPLDVKQHPCSARAFTRASLPRCASAPRLPGTDDEGDAEGDDVTDAGAPGVAPAPKRGRGGGVATASEAETLATQESLRRKALRASLESDPMFHRTSKLFDEGGASGGRFLGLLERLQLPGPLERLQLPGPLSVGS
jgi:hypothetical protein